MNNNLEQSNSIDGLDKLISKEKQKQGHSIWGNLIISLILPPFSTLWVLYQVWKNNTLHLLLPAMTILYSVQLFDGFFSKGIYCGFCRQD